MASLFLGGIPTDPDVKRIREALGEMNEGEEIPHTRIEELIGKKASSSRYRTVTARWRKTVLRELNVEIGAVPGMGFRVLSGSERIEHNHAKFRSASRQQGRAVRRIGMIPDAVLSDQDRHRRDRIHQLTSTAVENVALVAKQIEPPRAVQSLPRFVPEVGTTQ